MENKQALSKRRRKRSKWKSDEAEQGRNQLDFSVTQGSAAICGRRCVGRCLNPCTSATTRDCSRQQRASRFVRPLARDPCRPAPPRSPSTATEIALPLPPPAGSFTS
eukprot:4492364-Pleurochrysis_carterae.AAC.2